ncbi:hypothetical protein ACFQMF_01530 [Halorubrum rutilum]|uniref:Phage protein D n=1 Tax=Halorubrum rutilum TaxID=1364933 RepID=A0ABD6AH47_9EURY|nr:hypothetical protein [Halorubrum rutilum]
MPIATEPVYGSVSVGGETYRIVLGGETPAGSTSPDGLTYDIDRFNTSAELEADILMETPPTEDRIVSCSLQGETIFTGSVTKAEQRSGFVHLIANDVVHELKRATLTQSFTEADIATIAKAALGAADFNARSSAMIDLPAETTSAEFSEERCDKILEDVSDWGNAVWGVDTADSVYLTQLIGARTTRHELEQVVDAAPGERTMPYQSVRVEGASPASRKGQQSMHLVASESVRATAGDGEPQFTHQDSRIKTKAMAENAAEAILTELKRQRGTGTITVAGDPTIRPYDTVSPLDTIDTGEYLVSGIQHRITSQDGFRTTIQCGGVVS